MAERPLSEKMRAVLVALLDGNDRGRNRTMSANQIAYALGYAPGMARSGNHGRGNVARTMGVAVHVNTALTALGRRGLVRTGRHPSGLSGTGFLLTSDGEEEARKARAAGVVPRQVAAGRKTKDEEAWGAINGRRGHG